MGDARRAQQAVALAGVLGYHVPLEKLMRLLLIALLFLLLAPPARARLGENEEQCVRRYGPVVGHYSTHDPGLDLPVLVFNKNGYAVSATLLNSRVRELKVRKLDDSDLSDNEMGIFLNANRENLKWIRQPAMSLKSYWLRDDGAQAEYNPINHTLTLTAAEYLAAKAAAVKVDEVKRTEGF